MIGLFIVYGFGAAFGIGFYIWLHTKSGEKWLNSLDD